MAGAKTFIHHDLKGRRQKESEKIVMLQAQLQLLINMLDEEGDVDEAQISAIQQCFNTSYG